MKTLTEIASELNAAAVRFDALRADLMEAMQQDFHPNRDAAEIQSMRDQIHNCATRLVSLNALLSA